MLSIGVVDAHRTRQPYKLVCSRVRHDSDDQLAVPASHRAAVLQNEGALPALESAGDLLHRHVPGRVLDAGAERKHLALARRLQVPVKLLVEGEPAKYRVLAWRLWYELHIERTGSNHLVLLGWDLSRGHANASPKAPGGVLTNGLRLSCGALKKDSSFSILRAPSASSVG